MFVRALQHTSIYQRDPNESEESEGEGGPGNVSRLVVRPPGHSGKAKRGHLCFDAAFEGGNLGRAEHVTELEYDLHVRPDTCRPRARFWFNFTVDNAKQDQRVIFNFANLGKERNLYCGEMTPLVRSSSRSKWQRMPGRLVWWHRSAQHGGRRVLSLAFAFDREEEVYQFAAAAPYSYSRLQAHLAAWQRRPHARRDLLANTTQKRRVDLLSVGGEAAAGAGPKRVVLVTARAHGGEPPASYICQGLIDFLISSHTAAAALRTGVRVEVVPMLNPDGVFLGNQRADLLGADLNRAWNRISPWAHPVLHALQEHIDKRIADKSIQLDFMVDIHANLSREGVFIHGNTYDDVYRFERHAVLGKFVGARTEAWSAEGCLYNSDASKAGTARRALAARLDAYSLLVSVGGRRLAPRAPYMHYNEDAYLRVGRCFGRALCDYYRHIGVIAPSTGGKGEPRKRTRQRRAWRRAPAAPDTSEGESEPRGRCVAPRTLTPPLPARAAPERAPPRVRRARRLCGEPRQEVSPPPVLRAPPRLAVLDVNAIVRELRKPRAPHARAARRRARPPLHTSDEYSTADGDSDSY